MIFNGKPIYVVDLEADGLLDTITKVHCLGFSYETNGEWTVKTTVEKVHIKSLFESDCYIVGHNFINYDLEAIAKIYPDIEVKATIWDSLFMSYGLFDQRHKHGLAYWGETFGVPKPEVEDWISAPVEVYLHRVAEDVRINTKMFMKFWDLMMELYGDDSGGMTRHINYLNFLAKKSNAQQGLSFKVDVEEATSLLNELEEKKKKVVDILMASMPKNEVKAVKKKPAKCYKKNGDVSGTGQRWFDFLEHCGLPITHTEDVPYIKALEEPNPGSPPQLKKWFFDLGWEPIEFSEGANGPVPQMRVEIDGIKELCPSVIQLAEQEPSIMALSDLGVLTHRIGVLSGKSGFLTSNSGYPDFQIKQYVTALANTYRYRHGGLVNIPKQKAYSKELRRCLIAPDGYKLVSGDVKALEDTTKMISIQPFDPDYVEELRDPDFDAHCDIAVRAEIMTKEGLLRYKELKAKGKNKATPLSDAENKEFDELGKKRQAGKTVNFSATYKAGPAKIASTLKRPLKFGQKLHTAYWDRNWSIKEFEDSLRVTHTKDKRMWLKSNISGFYLSLRNDKDKFSLHNQNMGRFLFDMYTAYLERLTGYLPCYDQHDDASYCIPTDKVEWFMTQQKAAMRMVNQKYNLVIPLQIEPMVGDNLSEI